MPIFHDFSDFPDDLFTLAIDQMTFGDVLEYDLPSRVLREAQDANARREALLAKDRYAYWDLWMRFAGGVENLLKAVFLRHQIFLIRKRHLLTKAPGGSKALSTPAAADVYRAVASVQLAVATNQWLQAQFAAAGIQHPLEIDTGTLGSNRKELPWLETAGKMTLAEAR